MTTNGAPRAPGRPRGRGGGLILVGRIVVLVVLVVLAVGALLATNGTAANAVRNVVRDTPLEESLADVLAVLPPTGPEQPIAFPHPVHLAAGITCKHCHIGTDTSAVASIASAELCMQCHNVVAADRPEIQKLKGYYDRHEPIPWVRVYNVPDFVYFSHRMHIAAGLQCAACHGDLTQQQKTYQANTLNMGFCITCHRANQAPIECYTCHK